MSLFHYDDGVSNSGSGGGHMDDGSNWQENAVPGSTDTASLDGQTINDGTCAATVVSAVLTNINGGTFLNPLAISGNEMEGFINGGAFNGITAMDVGFTVDPSTSIVSSGGSVFAANFSNSTISDDGTGVFSSSYTYAAPSGGVIRVAGQIGGGSWSGLVCCGAFNATLTGGNLFCVSFIGIQTGGEITLTINAGVIPAATDVRYGVAVGTRNGSLVVPAANIVLSSNTFDNGTAGTLPADHVMVAAGGTLPNSAVLPAASADGTLSITFAAAGDVRNGTSRGSVNAVSVGNGSLAVPALNQVANGVETDNATGTQAIVFAAATDVRNGTSRGSVNGVSAGNGSMSAGSTGEIMIPIAPATVTVAAGTTPTTIQDVSTAAQKVASLSLQVTAPAGANVSLAIGVRVAAGGAVATTLNYQLANHVISGVYPVKAGTTTVFADLPLPSAVDSVVVLATHDASTNKSVISSGSLA